jgi:hypothetical protein
MNGELDRIGKSLGTGESEDRQQRRAGAHGTHELGPPVEFEHLDQVAAPGSMDAWLKACLGQEYFVGAGPLEGLKSVATIEAMYRSAQSGQMEQVRGCEGLEASMAQGVVVH